MPAKRAELLGKRFGMVQVIGESASLFHGRAIPWTVKCDCGTVKTMTSERIKRMGDKCNCGCMKLKRHGRAFEQLSNATEAQCKALLELWQPLDAVLASAKLLQRSDPKVHQMGWDE